MFLPLGLTAVLLLSACSSLEFPGVYKLTIQQGNIVSQEMVDRLKPGMTRSQVQFVLGNPVLATLRTRSLELCVHHRYPWPSNH